MEIEDTTCSHVHRMKPSFMKAAKDDSLVDINYRTTFVFTNLEEKNYIGFQKISFKLGESTANEVPLRIHFIGLEIYSVIVDSEEIKNEEICYNRKYFEIQKSKFNPEKQTKEVFVAFRGEFATNKPFTGVGCYKYLNNFDQCHYVYTQCEPDFSQRIMPIFYNLNHKATFDFRFLTMKCNSAISNMNIFDQAYLDYEGIEEIEVSEKAIGDLLGSEDQKYSDILRNIDQLKQDLLTLLTPSDEDACRVTSFILRKFEKTPKMSFNVLAFAIGPYIKFSCSPYKDKIPVEFYCQRGTEDLLRANLARLESITKAGLNFYENYLKVDYPFTKYGNLFAPDFSFNAMENPGLVIIHQKNLLRPKNRRNNYWETINRDRMILHEMAHMWMGNLYTMNEWHDLWLKESTAEYFCHKAFNAILAEGQGLSKKLCDEHDIWINFVVRTAINNRSEKFPFDSDSYPLCFKDEDYMGSMVDYYGSIVYQKGSSYFKNLNFLIGEENFRDVFVKIIKKYSYKNLGDEDFKEILDGVMEGRDEELVSNAENWYQSHIHVKGYPRLTVESKHYDVSTKEFKVRVNIKWPKWTKIRCLILGKSSQKSELILEFGDFKPENNRTVTKEFLFEDVKFEPVVFIPNYKFDDFVHTIFDSDSLVNLFDGETRLYKCLDDYTSWAYVSHYLRYYMNYYGDEIRHSSEFLMNYFSAILDSRRGYLIERNNWVSESLNSAMIMDRESGIFDNVG